MPFSNQDSDSMSTPILLFILLRTKFSFMSLPSVLPCHPQIHNTTLVHLFPLFPSLPSPLLSLSIPYSQNHNSCSYMEQGFSLWIPSLYSQCCPEKNSNLHEIFRNSLKIIIALLKLPCKSNSASNRLIFLSLYL